MRNSLRTLFGIVIAVALLALGASAFHCLSEAIALMKHSDLAYRATGRAADRVELYVRAKGEWPKSWDDLEATIPSPTNDVSWKEVREFVDIDFTKTLEEVSRQQIESFDAIRPEPPIPANYVAFFDSLLKTVRRTLEQRSATESASSN